VREVRRYFSAMERDSAKLLGGIDAKLDDLYQRQYNLQSERAILERRRDGAKEVLRAVDACTGAVAQGDGIGEQHDGVPAA
jgi:hypothetical protein